MRTLYGMWLTLALLFAIFPTAQADPEIYGSCRPEATGGYRCEGAWIEADGSVC